MAIITTDNQHYTDIAAAIRSKNGTETLYKPSEMAAAIQAISGGGEPEPPDDGKTRLYITVPANAMPDRPPPRNQVPLYIQQSVANGVTIDWGDGTEPETLPGTGAVNTTHTYEQGGDYVISLEPAEGCELGFGDASGTKCIMGQVSYSGVIRVIAYPIMLKKVIVGKNVFNIYQYAFQYCYGVKSIVISNSVTSIEYSSFYDCYSIVSVVMPDSIVRIKPKAFFGCCGLPSLIIPKNVSNIEDYAFSHCYGMKEYHFLSPTPPTLNNTSVFNRIPSDCIIYVPVGSAEAYKTATNWTAYSQYIQEEPSE